MDMGLRGRVAVITGGARGIGWAEALAFGGEGCKVAIVDLDSEQAVESAQELVRRGIDCVSWCADAASEDDVQRTIGEIFNRFGRVDVLVNNAGIGVKPSYTVTEMPLHAWQQMIDVHMRSTFLWSRAAVPLMRRGGFGRIVNTSSMNFTGGGRPGVSHYAAAKAGIAGFTRTLAKEVGASGITSNAIAPGYVETELIAGFTPEMRALLARQNPVGRTCRPEEVAASVVFLSSVHASFINGALLCIDGGRRDFAWD